MGYIPPRRDHIVEDVLRMRRNRAICYAVLHLIAAGCAIAVLLALLLSCAHGEPLSTPAPPTDDCEICWGGCRDPKDEVAAYHCAWHCNEVCFNERADGGED